jgi:hypothetical protein
LQWMKYLAIIFSLYITLLTLMPCQDGEDISPRIAHTSSIQKPINGVEHNGQEICTPFCTCSCCSTSRHLITASNDEIVIYGISVPYATYKVPAIADQLLEIYQPPQIV